ncbi:MAG: ethylbenzene dehydrogenase-related protein [Chlorobiota bacterium]
MRRRCLGFLPILLLVLFGLSLWGCEAPGVGEFGSDAPLEVTPREVDFGNVRVRQTAELWLRIRNRADSAIILAPAITGADQSAFSIVRQPSGALRPGQTDSLLLRFSPTEARAYQATLLLGGDNPLSIPLRGTGTTGDRTELLAVVASTPPEIDGSASDAVWNAAPPLQLRLLQVEPTANDPRTFSATLRAAVDNEFLYLLVEVADPTPHETPNIFRFRGGDPASDANWTLTTEGQDGLGLIFPIGDPQSVRGDRPGETFATIGCAVACHPTATTNAYEGGSYPTYGRIDLWYWKAGTTNPQGYADDYVAEGRDGTAFPEERRGDVGNTFEEPNYPPRGAGPLLPISMAGGDNGGLDRRRFLWQATSVPFNPRAPNPATGRPWVAGDVVPGWALRDQEHPFSSRGDVHARGRHANGRWIIELRRRLSTEKDDDASFERGRSIPFSLAYFDNTRKYAIFEYLNLTSAPRPGHFGPNPPVIWLRLP